MYPTIRTTKQFKRLLSNIFAVQQKILKQAVGFSPTAGKYDKLNVCGTR
jgi:hypothetical protein